MAHTDKYLRVHDKYKALGNKSLRMLVTFIVRKLSMDDAIWVDLEQIARNRNPNRLCHFLDTYSRYFIDALPKATIDESDALAPNAQR